MRCTFKRMCTQLDLFQNQPHAECPSPASHLSQLSLLCSINWSAVRVILLIFRLPLVATIILIIFHLIKAILVIV